MATSTSTTTTATIPSTTDMNTALITQLVGPMLLTALVATGLILPALPILAMRLGWLLATNPVRIK